MAETQSRPRLVRFGVFEADVRTGELRKDGVKLKFSAQPFRVLAILLERPGDVVTREELQKRLWPDTFVDVERNLNTAVNKIREILGDSAESPRYLETLPRRGYRFIAPVETDISVVNRDPIEKPIDQPAKSAKSFRFLLPILSGAAILAIGLVLWISYSKTAGTPRVVRFTQLTNDGQVKSGPLATDGSRIYFNVRSASTGTIIVQVSVKGGETIPFAVPLKDPRLLDIARDGTELLLGNEEQFDLSSLWLQPVAGGSPRRIGMVLVGDANYGNYGANASFGADGTSVIYGSGHDIYSMNRDDASHRKLLTVEGVPFSFRFSPDARGLRFAQSDVQSGTASIFESMPDGTGLHQMFRGCCGEWTADARFFLFQQRNGRRNELWALPEGGRGFWQRKQDTKPIQLTRGPLDFHYPLPSKDGRNIFVVGISHRAEMLRYDDRSRDFVPYLPGVSADSVSFSPDGRWVTYTSYSDGTLWRSRTDGSERLQLTFPPLQAFLPRYSPDGKQIAFNAELPGEAWNIYIISSEGGTPQQVLPSNESQMDANWSPDGHWLIFASSSDPKKAIYIVDLKSKRVSTVPGSLGFFSPHWSPNGRYLSAIKAEVPRTLNLFDFTTQEWTEVFGSETGYENWSHDGTYLYFQSSNISDHSLRIQRIRIADRKIEEIPTQTRPSVYQIGRKQHIG